MAYSVWQAAIALLARREHARAELFQKLEMKGYFPADIIATLDSLEEKDYLNESRFIGCRIRFRVGCGMGPLKILSEFQFKYQIDKKSVVHHPAWQEIEWNSLAQGLREKKYGLQAPKTLKEKAAQTRFLQQRGFTVDQIQNKMK